MNLTHKYIVAELTGYYAKYSDNPIYQRQLLDVWETAGKGSGQYCGAYASAVKQIKTA